MERLRLDLPLLLKAVNDVLVTPAHLVRETLSGKGKYREYGEIVRRLTLTVQYFLPGFNRKTLNASGTTMRFFLSYGGGIPSKSFKRSRAAAPRAVLWGTMPRMARKRILEGARWWKGPDFLGLTMWRLWRKLWYRSWGKGEV